MSPTLTHVLSDAPSRKLSLNNLVGLPQNPLSVVRGGHVTNGGLCPLREGKPRTQLHWNSTQATSYFVISHTFILTLKTIAGRHLLKRHVFIGNSALSGDPVFRQARLPLDSSLQAQVSRVGRPLSHCGCSDATLPTTTCPVGKRPPSGGFQTPPQAGSDAHAQGHAHAWPKPADCPPSPHPCKLHSPDTRLGPVLRDPHLRGWLGHTRTKTEFAKVASALAGWFFFSA